MGQILIFALHCYFVAILVVSAIAKFDCLECFAETLRQQNILPKQLIYPISRTLPLVEWGLAYLLASGLIPQTSAIGVLLLFSIFWIMEVMLYRRNSSADCGCFGDARRQGVDSSSVTVSTILVTLALVKFAFIATGIEARGDFVQTVLLIVFLTANVFLFYKLFKRKGQERIIRQETLQNIMNSGISTIGITN